MRKPLSFILQSIMLLCACDDGGTAANLPRLVVEPDDGRALMLEAIASATDNIRLTIYALTDLRSVVKTLPAPAASIVQALIDKAKSGVAVRVIVDQNQYGGTRMVAPLMQQTVAAPRFTVLRSPDDAQLSNHPSSLRAKGATYLFESRVLYVE